VNKITRYFLAQFLHPLGVSVGALLVLVLVSELMEHMDKFIAGNAGVLLVGEYLLSLLPMRTVEVLPVAVLLATLFSLGNLSRRNEIIAAMSGGIHPWRCVQMILLCGAALSLAALLLSELIIPLTNRHAKTLWKMDIRHFASLRQTTFENLTVAGEGGVFYSLGLLDVEAKRVENVVVETVQGGLPKRHVQAKSGEWTPEGWVFRDGVERVYRPDGSGMEKQEPFRERTVSLKEAPEDLVPQEPDSEEMNYKQFKRHVRRLRTLGVSTRRQDVELAMKLAFPWTSLIVMFIGIPFAFQKSGSKVKAVGVSLAVAFLYFGLMEVGRALGQKPWCPAWFGAWLANLLFLSFGLWRFNKMKELA
jgi:lipopolysaccharide export system permease protein